MCRVDVYLRVRRAVMVDGMSMREASRVFGLHRDTVRKMLAYSAPPGYRRQDPPRRPRLEPFTGVIDAILEADRQVPKKQRHTAKRIFERLRDEHGFDGQYTIVKDYVRERRRRTQEMFVPLSHAPGHAQCDFGEARVIIGGVERKAHYLVLDLPHSDGCFVKAYPAETAEAFLDGHVSAFASLGGVPQSILYDNTKLAVARILGDGRRQRTRAFTELQSHYLFEDRFGRPGKGNDKGKVEGMVEPGEPHVPDQHDPERVVRVSEAVGKGLSTGLAPDVFLPVHGVGGGAGHDHLDFALGVVLILPFGAESHQLPVKLDADPPAHADDHRLSVQLLQPGIEMFENILCNLPDPVICPDHGLKLGPLGLELFLPFQFLPFGGDILNANHSEPGLPAPAPRENRADSWEEIAQTLLQTVPPGPFKSTDCQPIIQEHWPHHPIAKTQVLNR